METFTNSGSGGLEPEGLHPSSETDTGRVESNFDKVSILEWYGVDAKSGQGPAPGGRSGSRVSKPNSHHDQNRLHTRAVIPRATVITSGS